MAQCKRLLDEIPVGLFRVTPDGRILEVNQAFVSMFGYPDREAMLRLQVGDLYWDAAKRAERLAVLGETGVLLGETIEVRHAQGYPFWARVNARAVYDADGAVTVFEGSIEDMTAETEAAEALRRSEENYRSLVMNIPDVIWTADEKSRVRFISPNVEQVYGFTQTEVYAGGDGLFVDRIHPEDCARVQAAYEEFFLSGNVFDVEYRIRHKAGHYIWLHEKALRTYVKDGERLADGVFREVTARKEAERALRITRDELEQRVTQRTVELAESEQQFRALAESLSAIVLIHQGEYLVYANPATERVTGYSHAELMEMPFWNVVHPDAREMARARGLARQRGENEPTHYELKLLTGDGQERWVAVSATVCDYRGQPAGLTAAIDITERKLAELELRKFKTMADEANYGIGVLDLQGQLTYVNRSFAEMHGRTIDEVVGQHVSLFHSAQQMPRVRALNENLRTAGSYASQEVWHCRADGTEFPTLMSAAIVSDERGAPLFLIGTAIEITEHKRAEEELRRQALLFENMLDGVIITDAQSRIIDWNPAAARILGYSRAEALEHVVDDVLPADRVAHMRAAMQAGDKDHGRWSDVIPVTCRDGSTRVCETVVVGLDGCAEPGQLIVVRDVTDQRQAEEEARRRRDELAHVARVAALGEMATGLAHELNQPLTAILYFARGCSRRLAGGSWDSNEVAEVIERIASQAERAAAFIERVRSFVRKDHPRFASIDVHEPLHGAAEFLAHDLREQGVAVRFELDEQLRRVHADPIELEQVILNLLRNAIEAVRDNTPGERAVTLRTASMAGEAAVISVEDNGCGFAESDSASLFDAFYTTKANGLGMGLGISRTIVEAHGGRLWAVSQPGQGATFRFTVPFAQTEEPGRES